MASVTVDEDNRPVEDWQTGGPGTSEPGPDPEQNGGNDGVFGDTSDAGGPQQNTNSGTRSGSDDGGGRPPEDTPNPGPPNESDIVGTVDEDGTNQGGNGQNQQDPRGFAMPGAGGVTGWGQGAGTSGRAGAIDPRTGSEYEATTREVQDEELVANQLTDLLDSDSRYIRQARNRGLAAANARGGLGGTMQAAASTAAAIRAGLPIATADAQAFRDAAAQNMNALNQFGLANMQRATQIAMANLDARTRVQTTAMNNASNQAIAKLQSMTQLQNTALQGEIQARLAEQQFMITQVLNAEQHGYAMEQTALQGEYNLANTQMQGEYNLDATQLQGDIQYRIQRETNYTNQAMSAMDVYFQRLDNLNGMEMDDAARERARQQYYNDYVSQMNFLNSLYPDVDPISIVEPPGDG